MVAKHLILVLADISGYTRFTRLRALSQLHAEQIITELLEAVIDQARYPLQISKLEGDAVFLYADSAGDPQAAAADVLRQVQGFFHAFRARTRALVAANLCVCQACGEIGQLRLKVIAHAGDAVLKRVRQFDELGGEAVILVHRLAKNSIPAPEYLLATEAFYGLSGPWAGLEPERRVETPDGLAPESVMVFYPPAPDGPAPRRPLGDRLAQFARLTGLSVLRRLGWLQRPRGGLPAAGRERAAPGAA